MNAYKKRGLISILTMVLVIGLLSTALAITTDSNHRRHSNDGDDRQHSGHSGEGNNRRANIKNYNSIVNTNNKGKQARSGRGETTPVMIPASTSVTVAPTGNSENTDADHHLSGKVGDASQPKGHSNEGNNHRAYIKNLNGDKNSNNRDNQVRSETTPVKITASTSDTAAPTDNLENTDANHLYGKGGDVSQLKGHSDDHTRNETTPVMIPASTSVTVAPTGNSENTDADHHLSGKVGDASQPKGHSNEGNNHRAYIKNLKVDANNNNRDDHARSETSPVTIPTSTSDTAAPTGNSENTDADHHLSGKVGDASQPKGHSNEGNNHRAYIKNLNGDKNSNNRDNHVRSETTPVKITASTSDTAAPTDS